MLVMLMPLSHHSSLAALEKQPPAMTVPDSVHGTDSDVGVEEQVPTPREPSPTGDSAPGPPPVVQSSSSSAEAVAGPSHVSPCEDFNEHQALLRRVTSNLGLEVEELAEQSGNLFNILTVAARS